MEFGLVGLWLVSLLGLGLLAAPIATWLFPDLDAPTLSIPLALAVLGVFGHLVGHLAFGWPALAAGLAGLLGGAYLTVDRVTLDRGRLLEAAAVFTGAFLLMVTVRAFAPAAAPLPIAIGEKLLDYGLLRSLERAPALPPEDMWFAGEPVRYHYGGHLITVLLSTLTATPAKYAYNLGLASFFAALVTAAYGLGGSIASPTEVPRRTAAAFSAFFVGFAGNLDTPARLVIWLLPSGPANWLATGLDYDPTVLEWTPTDFWFFTASRVFPIDPTATDSFDAATEFPLFAWLNGDLHAHMMSQPFMLLVVGMLLAAWRADSTGRCRLLLFGALPPVAGLVGVVNVWSFPTVGGLVLIAVWLGPDTDRVLPTERLSWPAVGSSLDRPWPGELGEEARRLGIGVAAGMAVLGLGIVWTAPFWFGVVAGGPGRAPGYWGRWTDLGGLLRVHGAFLVVFWAYLVGALAVAVRSPQGFWAAGLAILGVGILLGGPAVGLVLPLGLGAWWLLRRRPDPDFVLLLVLAGAGLVLLVELVTVQGERFNTVFKYYAHVWLFWSIAAGVGLARIAGGWPVRTDAVSLPRWEPIGRGLAVVIVVSTAVYAGFALPAHVGDPGPAVSASGPTLDATAYLEERFPAEAGAIRWLDARDGRPTIVTAAPGGYWWRPERGDGASAPASLSGLPTVLGWFHERQYRGPDDYRTRIEHVRSIYTGPPDRQRALLRRYDVRYVYIGPAERARYGEITVGSLDGVTIARQWEAVTIYRVDRSAGGG